MWHPSLGGDMLYGMRAIADFLGIKPRQALHLVETDWLPHFREGKVICGRRSTLTAWLEQREAKSRERGPRLMAEPTPDLQGIIGALVGGKAVAF